MKTVVNHKYQCSCRECNIARYGLGCIHYSPHDFIDLCRGNHCTYFEKEIKCVEIVDENG